MFRNARRCHQWQIQPVDVAKVGRGSLSCSSVVVVEDQFTSPCPCPWTTKSLKIVKDLEFCKHSAASDHVKSINSVTAAVHEVTVKNGLLITYYKVSKPFFVVTQSC